MSYEDDGRFEDELRRACGAEDPGEAFTQRVLHRVTADGGRPTGFARDGGWTSAAAGSAWRMALPFAASLAIAAGGAAWLQHERYVAEGERARAQVLMALRLTSEKLNVARSAVIEMQERGEETER